MNFEPDTPPPGKNRILAYTPDAIQVNERVLRHSFILTPDRLLENWSPNTFEELNKSHIQEIQRLEPELVLLGSGFRLCIPAPAILAPLFEAGIGFEAMDTGAACRSYNILMSEGRKVAAALLVCKQPMTHGDIP